MWKAATSQVDDWIHTQVAVDNFAVVHLAPHGSDLLEFGLLTLHPVFQPLQFLCLRHGLLLTPLLLLQITQTLLLRRENQCQKAKAHLWLDIFKNIFCNGINKNYIP